jgi:integrase
MSQNNSIQRPQLRKSRKRKQKKPEKPYPEFPLFPHATRRWAKKIRGKMHYFGKWEDPDGALAKYNEQKDDLHAGRTPRAEPEGLTVRTLANHFLTHKRRLLDNGEITHRTWLEYHGSCERLVTAFGKNRLVDDLAADDFERLRSFIAESWGPIRLGNEIQRVRSIFKYGYEAGLIDKPTRYGPGFKRPSKKVLRLERAKQGPKLFTREEIHKVLTAAPVHLRAMILLGINVGFGNADCGTLPLSALNLETGWIDYPRPKTGIPRRAKLWPETVQALRESLAKRPEPKESKDAGLVFITKYGKSWGKDIPDNPVAKEMRKLLDSLGINGRRNFYCLRHTFRTVADESRDQPAIDHVMGHESPHMSTFYRETISDDRLAAVAEHVRTWLFGTSQVS